MRRRFIPAPSSQPVQIDLQQYRLASVRALTEALKPLNTFTEIAMLLGVSHEFVRSRLTELDKREHVLLKRGRTYLVPQAVAEHFIRSQFQLT